MRVSTLIAFAAATLLTVSIAKADPYRISVIPTDNSGAVVFSFNTTTDYDAADSPAGYAVYTATLEDSMGDFTSSFGLENSGTGGIVAPDFYYLGRNGSEFAYYGPELVSGDPANPMFVTGTQHLFALGTPFSDATSDVNVDIIATPEPSSFALLGTGVVAAAGVVRRRMLA